MRSSPNSMVVIFAASVLVFYFQHQPVKAAERPLQIQELRSERIAAPRLFSAVKRSASGDIQFLTGSRSQPWVFQTISRKAGSSEVLVSRFALQEIPESANARLRLMPDFAVDDHGDVYVPGIWRQAARRTSFGAFVFGRDGAYKRTAVFSPPTEVRHISIDSDGNLFILGIDPAYFRHQTNECLLVHKYANDGRRLSAFSECPSELDLLRPADMAPGPDFNRLALEVDRGLLFVYRGWVYHVLPLSREVRIFDLDGKRVRQIRLESPQVTDVPAGFPATAPRREEVWRLLPFADGRLLVEWLHLAQDGSSRLSFRRIALHSSNGQAISAATPLPWPRSIPIFTDDLGHCYFLRDLPDQGIELVQARLTTR